MLASCGSPSPVSTSNGGDAAPSVPTSVPEMDLVAQDPTVALGVIGKLLDAVVADDRSQIGRHLGESESSLLTGEQLENVFGFAAASGWVDDVDSCEPGSQADSEGPVLGVVCRITSGHPIFGATGEVVAWSLSVEGDKVVDADPTPYLQNTTNDEDLFQWLMTQHPDSTLERCDPDAHSPSEVVVSETGYTLDARCGAYLTALMPEFFVATEPDHPVAVWYRFDDAFDNARLSDVMELFAEDAVMQHLAGDGQTGSSNTYTGHDEIREWAQLEFDAFLGYDRIFSDFSLEGSVVRFKAVWGPRGGSPEGGGLFESVVEDGLILRWVELERLLFYR